MCPRPSSALSAALSTLKSSLSAALCPANTAFFS
ncbi:hypothetical protein VCHC41A1_2425, partial [Vibrio cholerae HC-41A1]